MFTITISEYGDYASVERSKYVTTEEFIIRVSERLRKNLQLQAKL